MMFLCIYNFPNAFYLQIKDYIIPIISYFKK